MIQVEILSQGDEVVSGQVVDSNAAEIARAVEGLGLHVLRHGAVRDDAQQIAAALRCAAGRAQEVICTGGLGPTLDDCTAEAAALAFDLPLEERPAALQQVQARYAAFKRPLDEAGRRQARIPAGAALLENRWGTAPGFAVDSGGARLWFLPGVPREMRPMLRAHVLPGLRKRHATQPRRVVTLRCLGLHESRLQQCLRPLRLPLGLRLGYRAVVPEVQVKLYVRQGVEEPVVQGALQELRGALGRAVFGVEDEQAGLRSGPIAAVVGRALAARGETVATAESCTAGRVAAAITAVPGSSQWFMEGAVVYSDAAKRRQCGVPPEVLETHGAVSEPVARALAEGIRRRAGTSWGLSATGIAGPGGGTEEKPLGTVHIAVAGAGGTTWRRLRLPGDREMVMGLTVGSVLDLLRRRLEGGAHL